MLEPYSHIRMAAKRGAVEALALTPTRPERSAEAPTKGADSDGVTTKVPTVGPQPRLQ